jgi:hypothetical protein
MPPSARVASITTSVPEGGFLMYIHGSVAERFWPRIDQSGGPDSCWIWTGGTASGYGRMGIKGREVGSSHRISWQLHFGPIPGGLHVLHRCDNPPCCNPSHLFLGTQADNNYDREAKGRGTTPPNAKGTDSPNAKLTEQDVINIRTAASSGEPMRRIARRYLAGRTAVRNVVKRKTWMHVP